MGSCSQRKKGLKEGIEVAFLRHFKKRKCLVFLVVKIRVSFKILRNALSKKVD